MTRKTSKIKCKHLHIEAGWFVKKTVKNVKENTTDTVKYQMLTKPMVKYFRDACKQRDGQEKSLKYMRNLRNMTELKKLETYEWKKWLKTAWNIEPTGQRGSAETCKILRPVQILSWPKGSDQSFPSYQRDFSASFAVDNFWANFILLNFYANSESLYSH
jgi:hypothetical protein